MLLHEKKSEKSNCFKISSTLEFKTTIYLPVFIKENFKNVPKSYIKADILMENI